jgi:hypothetical protein
MTYFIRNNHGKTTLTDDAPEWLLDAVREAHDGEAPNEWRWIHCAALYHAISEGSDIDQECDSLVDIYYTDLFQWLADEPTRRYYCDDVIAEGLHSEATLYAIVASAQRVALDLMAGIIREACEENE